MDFFVYASSTFEISQAKCKLLYLLTLYFFKALLIASLYIYGWLCGHPPHCPLVCPKYCHINNSLACYFISSNSSNHLTVQHQSSSQSFPSKPYTACSPPTFSPHVSFYDFTLQKMYIFFTTLSCLSAQASFFKTPYTRNTSLILIIMAPSSFCKFLLNARDSKAFCGL